MSLKKILISLLCALCAVSLLIPAAFAHGGHGRGVRAQARTYQCAVCPVEGCEVAGRHYHDGTLYCGANHAAGYCSGSCGWYTQASGGCHGGGHHCGW